MARVHKGLPLGSGGRDVYRLRMQGWEQWGLQLGAERGAHAECSCRRGRSAGAVPLVPAHPITMIRPSAHLLCHFPEILSPTPIGTLTIAAFSCSNREA